MIFTIFVAVAVWLSPLPLWIQIVITIGAVFHLAELSNITININREEK